MDPGNFAIETFLFCQITVGIFGNSSILFYYIIFIFTEKHLMPKDLIIEHLTIANCLTIILRGFPQTMTYFGFKNFLDDMGCKLIVYISQITRGCPFMPCAYWVVSKQSLSAPGTPSGWSWNTEQPSTSVPPAQSVGLCTCF